MAFKMIHGRSEKYGENLGANLSEAWKMAQEAIQLTQSKQKQYYADGTRSVPVQAISKKW